MWSCLVILLDNPKEEGLGLILFNIQFLKIHSLASNLYIHHVLSIVSQMFKSFS